MSTAKEVTAPINKPTIETDYKSSNQLVIDSARHRWSEILISHGIADHFLSGEHTQCPIHGGKDGFLYKNDKNKGDWVCATCTEGKFKDGINLIAMYCCNGSNTEAFKSVASYLGLNGNSPFKKNNETQLSNSIQDHPQQPTTKPEQDQKLLARKKAASAHADNLLSFCVMRPHPYLQKKGIDTPVLGDNYLCRLTTIRTAGLN